MKTTKLIILITTVAALGVLATGIVFAHYTTPPAYRNGPYPEDTGFYGWAGGCYRGYEDPYYWYPPTTQEPDSNTAEEPQTPLPPHQPYTPRPDYPFTPQYPNQGYYPRGYGRGCWGW